MELYDSTQAPARPPTYPHPPPPPCYPPAPAPTHTLPQAKLRAMEGKLIKGEAKGGLLALTQAKEQEIARREAELAKRWVGGLQRGGVRQG